MPPPIRTGFAGRTAARWHTADLHIRRGAVTLTAQPGRVVRDAVGNEARGEGTEVTTARVLIFGAPTLDIQREDRLTVDGVRYTVTFIRPDRTVETVAEAETQQ